MAIDSAYKTIRRTGVVSVRRLMRRPRWCRAKQVW